MSTNSAKAKELLGSKGISPTAQRLSVLSFLLGTRQHPTIDEVYSSVKKTIPTISKTTLYNTLELFVEKGLAGKVNINPSMVRFDGFIDPHHHFLCERCGKLLDIMIKCPNAELGCVAGHKIRLVHGYFYGTCKDCLKRERRNKK